MAGSDTTIAFVQHFIFAMVAHPEKQKKAQEEIDRVIGHDRLPNITELRIQILFRISPFSR